MPTKQRTRTDFMCLTISAGQGVEVASDAVPGSKCYRFRIGIQSDSTGARTRFDYFGSVHDHDCRIDQLDRDGLLYALWSFVGDAAAGDETFEDFCGDYGYDNDSISAKRSHDACKAARAKLRRLFHDDREPSAVLELLEAEGIA